MPNDSVADDVADLLEAQAWAGWAVFVNEMPPEPHQVIGIFEAGGSPPETRVDIDRPAFQVRVRAGPHDWRAARAKARDAFNVLHKWTGALTGTYYVAIVAAGDVLTLGLDQRERPELVQTYDAIRSR